METQLESESYPTPSHSVNRSRSKESHPLWFYLVSIATGVAITLLCCVSLEIAYRLEKRHSFTIPPPTWVADPELIYKLNPANPQFPRSFRGKAPSPTKKTEFRVICMGGSTTWGTSVRAEDAWPAVVERVLKIKGIDAEVINAGVPGYGSRQLLLRYRREIAVLQPDYVVVYEGWNRTGTLVDPGAWIPFGFGIPVPGEKRSSTMATCIIRHSLILQRILTWVALRHGAEARWLKAPYQMDPYQDVFVEDFTELVKEIQAHHQQPVLILYPALYFPSMTREEQALFETMLWPRRSFQQDMVRELERKHASLRAIAQSTGTPLVDVQGRFSSAHGQQRASLFLDEMHLSVTGNQAAGEIIGSFLADVILHPRRSRMATYPGDGSVQ